MISITVNTNFFNNINYTNVDYKHYSTKNRYFQIQCTEEDEKI